MNNPFEIIDARLSHIETLILDLKHQQPLSVVSDSPDKLLTIQEAAELLNLSVPTMYSKVSKNELPVMKRSKRLYFSRAELIEYLKAGKRRSSAEISAEANFYLSNKKSAVL